MEVIIKENNSDKSSFEQKTEVLKHLEEKIELWMKDHVNKRKLWFSSDFLPADEKMNDDQENNIKNLRNRTRGLKDEVRVAVALNLLTEEGLPHFHRLIAQYLGDRSFWSKWNNMWTAEEDRHGAILRDYVRDARLFSFREVELMQFHYLESGFNPDWDKDPYKVFVYTTLQERATQFSHKNTAKLAGEDEPLLNGILSNIAADEAKHFTFYRNVFKEIINLDPNNALLSAVDSMRSIDMPGFSMPNVRDMAVVERRVGIYGLRDYK